MKRMKLNNWKSILWLTVLIPGLALAFTGCQDAGDEMEDAAEETMDAADEAADEVGDAAENAGDEIDDAM
jgi:hypothetical protein